MLGTALVCHSGALAQYGGAANPVPPTVAPASAASTEAAPRPMPCPREVPADARCLGGTDSAGAHYLIAMPARWNGHLVLHAHGGPLLGTPTPERVAEDLTRWAIMVRAGYLWAGSTFAEGGVQVRAAARDTERLRQIVRAHVAQPVRTILHGQSWGAGVAAVGAEMFTEGRPYDAVLLTSGVLGGGSRSYDFRLDLRVIYQHLCRNHPRPDEAAYPLWMGLPPGARMERTDLNARMRECLGIGLPAGQRTPEQAQRLRTLATVLKIPESSVAGHMAWATFHFQDISSLRTGGRPVFGNVGAMYRGSDDDQALNAGVARYAVDAQALAAFAADTDPGGRIPVPVLSAHAVDDPVAFVELEHEFQRTMARAGRADALVQVFTAHAEHSYLADTLYPALLAELLQWVERGVKPSPSSVAQRCEALRAQFSADCRLLPEYRVQPLESRVTPRQRP